MFQRGGNWWFRYTPAPGAAQVRESLGTPHRGLAAARAVEIRERAPMEAAAEFRVEMERYFAEGQEEDTLSLNTVLCRRKALIRYAETCGVSKLAQLTEASVERWARAMRDAGRRASSVETNIYHLRAVCSWLVRKNKMRSNVARSVRLGKQVVKGRRNFVTKDKIRDLLAAAPNDDFRFILFCGFHAGMRKLEITEARPGWFRLGEGERRGSISIEQTPTYRPKDREERTVPLSAEFESFLRGYLAKLPKGAVWVLYPMQAKRRANTPYRIHFARSFRSFIKVQGIQCTPHDMRRSFVSNKVIENSTLIFKLAKWTGTDVRTLQKHYGHLLPDDKDIEAGL